MVGGVSINEIGKIPIDDEFLKKITPTFTYPKGLSPTNGTKAHPLLNMRRLILPWKECLGSLPFSAILAL